MHKESMRKQAKAHHSEWSEQPITPGRGLGATIAIITSQNRKNHKMTRSSQEKERN